MKIAVVDLGTNTFNLLLSRFSEKVYSVDDSHKYPVNLGRGSINQGIISEEAMERGYKALEEYTLKIREFAPDRVFAFATSAIRNASNGKLFTEEAKRRTGIEIEVIDGNREAELIFHGVELSGALEKDNALVMDIGGGSTEFIIGNSDGILWKRSFELGAARLLDKFELSDPITQEEIFRVEEYLSSLLQELDEAVKEFTPGILIGSSGSFDTLAEMIANRFYQPSILEKKTCFEFKLDDYYSIHEQLMRSTQQEHLRTKGIMEIRVDMIVVATLFVFYIIRRYGISRMKLSTYSLKEGVLNNILRGKL